MQLLKIRHLESHEGRDLDRYVRGEVCLYSVAIHFASSYTNFLYTPPTPQQYNDLVACENWQNTTTMNSLKSFMNKVGERVREVGPQVSGQPLGDNQVDGEAGEAVEGFLCPTCYLRFATPEVLQEHYEAEHIEPAANYLCPVCKARLNSQPELEKHYSNVHSVKDTSGHSLEALREELTELSTNLREERWYSEELKKEVERLQEAFKKKDGGEDNFVHKSQLEAVEESKTLLTSEVVLLRNQLAESIETNGSLRSEKDMLESRASEFAVERAELRATLDTLQAEKVGLESELHELRSNRANQGTQEQSEAHHLHQEVTRLQDQLGAREKESATVSEVEDRYRQDLLTMREKFINSDIQVRLQNEAHKPTEPGKTTSFQAREVALQSDLKAKSELAASLKEEIRNLKDEVDIMKKKLQEKDQATLQLQNQLETQEAAAASSGQQGDELRAKCANYMENIQALEAQVSELSLKYTATQSDLDSLREQVPSLQTRLTEAESDKNNLTRELSEKVGELESLREKVNDASKEESEVLQKKTEQVEELRRSLRDAEHSRTTAENALTGKNEAIEQLKNKLTNSGNALKDASGKIGVLEGSVREREKEIKELKTKVKEIEVLKSDLAKEKELVRGKEAEIEGHKKRLAQLEGQKVELEQKLTDSKDSQSKVESSLEAVRAELESHTESLKKKCHELEETRSKMKLETSEKESLKTKLSAAMMEAEKLKENTEKLQSSTTALETDLKAIQARNATIDMEVKRLATEKSQLQEKLTSLETEKMKLENTIKENTARHAQEVKVLEEKLSGMTLEKSALSEQLSGMKDEKETMVKARDLTAHEMKTVKGDLQEARGRVKDVEGQVEGFMKDTFSLTQDKARLEGELNVLEEKLNEEMSLRQAEAAQHAAAVAGERQDREEAEELLTAAQEACTKVEREATTRAQAHKEEVGRLTQQLEEHVSNVSEMEGHVATLQAEVAGLAGDKLELEVRVEAAGEERNGLMERCVAAESEVERLSGHLTELRRKLDDSTAAIHELGRENQNLQIETRKLAGRKWADDSEAVSCQSCDKAFSVTVRRHHCRNCGQIFCHDCSSKQAPLEANKKSVRVCDSCYNELTAKM
ncbi:hypothetical protein Pcinc_037436 [Petrolisthes cinctipes]|uniref:Early endosome antigen 1 n=1 Tax=Petrolisthes cinctipes TaxID=88211 RepID=A0AAE1EL07_PETCI|nr:hypothetical protein Pcinc_037436 [Petrolisthes cinctipes]